MSNTMTLDDLVRILAACAGESDAFEPGDEIHDQDFDELGYDSLALMETAVRIENEYGVHIPDELIPDLRTPRHVLDLVNEATAKAS